MKGWLLDTNILSLLAPRRDGSRRIEDEFSRWLLVNTDSLFVSAVSISEIQAGIAKLRRSGAMRRSEEYLAWLGLLIDSYGSRMLPFNCDVAMVAGEIVDRAVALGRHPGISDIFIAATAERHGLAILADNIRHFEPLALTVLVVNPLRKIPDRLA